MRAVLRFVLWGLVAIVALVAVLAGLFAWFVYTPAPDVPHLSGKLTRGSIQVGRLTRTYAVYAPRNLRGGAPLVVALHGSGEGGGQMRIETGYGFERLADEQGFAVVYPNGYEGYWNACNIIGDYSANRLDIDDVGFLTGLADKLVAEIGADPDRVFATGVSRGGHMAMRLAIEAPSRFRAVAAVSASLPTPDNFKCRPATQGAASVMIMNGTKDPLNPFAGGEVRLLGLFGRGTVLSSRASGEYFADLDHIAGRPETIDAGQVEQLSWRNGARTEVELVAVRGGGHGMPQPYRRNPRILGPTAKGVNGPALIWAFFARQRPG